MAQMEVIKPVDAAEEEANDGGRRRGNPKIIIGAVALLLIIGGLVAWLHFRGRESTDNAQIEGDVVPVSARVGGTVTKVLVEDNQWVEAGTLLVQLDPTDYQIAAKRAQADYESQAAAANAARTSVPIASTNTASAVRTAQAGLNAANKQVDLAKARLAEAQANHTRAANDLARYKALVDKDEIPRQQYDAAVAQELAARANVDSANAAVATAQSGVAEAQARVEAAATAPQQVAVTRAQAGGAEASSEKNAAALEQANLNLKYTEIRASVSGIVSKKSVQVGQVIQPGQPLMAVVPVDKVWVVANFKETQLKQMRPGQEVNVKVDAYGRDYKAKVDSIGGATAARFSLLPPENATGNYVKVVQRVPVKIVFEQGQDKEHLLRPGMSVEPVVFVGK